MGAVNQSIPFTQYVRPNGRKRTVSIERPDEIVAKAAGLIKAGARFEIEELTDGTVSMTVEHPDAEDEGQSVSHLLCANGPDVPATVDRLVEDAYLRLLPACDFARGGNGVAP